MWYVVGPRPASGKRTPLPCTVHHRHRRRCDRPKVQQKTHLAVKNNAFLETVATVNRAVGVQGRLEDNQERLVASGKTAPGEAGW